MFKQEIVHKIPLHTSMNYLEGMLISHVLKFGGYASIFNILDHNNDIIQCGAINKSVHDVKLLWQHDTAKPIGKITYLQGDEIGLYVEGEILLALQQGKEALHLLQSNAINGLSIGYQVVDSFVDRVSKVRYIKDLLLWEVSVVTIPANSLAVISDIQLIPVVSCHHSMKEANKIGKKTSLKKMVGGSGIEPPTSTMST
ncbi:HK97 family phage prohead protease [Alphaproteobacteria bacterium]